MNEVERGKFMKMESDHSVYIEQKPFSNEQTSEIESEGDKDLKNDCNGTKKSDNFPSSEHYLTTIIVSKEEHSCMLKIEDNEPKLQENDNIADKEAFYMPEHFLSQTLVENVTNENMDIKYVIGASAETLYTLTYTHDNGRKRVNYSCNVCKREYKDKKDCIRHVRIHTGEKPFKCFHCGQSFGRECYLSNHIKTHTGEKPFSCPLCQKDFARKATLEQHLLTHTDMSLRPFPCNQCERGFTKRSHLESHLKIHAQIRDFKCSMCDKDFLEKRGLIDHMKRRHSDRVLLSCEICNREFKWEHHLRQHMKAHENKSSIQETEEQSSETLPVFVSDGKKESQSNDLAATDNDNVSTASQNIAFFIALKLMKKENMVSK